MSGSPLTLVFTDLVDSAAVKAALPGADPVERGRAYMDTVLGPHRRLVQQGLAQHGGVVGQDAR